MKKPLLSILLSFSVLTACSNPKPETPSKVKTGKGSSDVEKADEGVTKPEPVTGADDTVTAPEPVTGGNSEPDADDYSDSGAKKDPSSTKKESSSQNEVSELDTFSDSQFKEFVGKIVYDGFSSRGYKYQGIHESKCPADKSACLPKAEAAIKFEAACKASGFVLVLESCCEHKACTGLPTP